MHMTQNDLESLIKRNRMQHFKCFTISSFVIKVSGTHKMKLFTLLVTRHLWSHKEVPITTLFDFPSQVCGAVGLCNAQFRILCMTLKKLQVFLNNPEILIPKSYRAASCCAGWHTNKDCFEKLTNWATEETDLASTQWRDSVKKQDSYGQQDTQWSQRSN